MIAEHSYRLVKVEPGPLSVLKTTLDCLVGLLAGAQTRHLDCRNTPIAGGA
jgi:hypothetical protein